MASMAEPVPPRVVAPAGLGALLFGLTLAAGSAEALPFVVNSTLDTADAALNGVCDVGGGVCTLRAAIQESNFGGVGNTITFNITPLGGVKTIPVNSTGLGGLPPITRAVTINGYTQGVATPNSLAVGNNAVLLIELNGAATLAGVNGLSITAPTTVRGLVINRFAGYGIQVGGGGAGSVIAGNFVGTNTLGTLASANNRDGAGFEAGIGLTVGGVTIGGTAPADRNLVSGQNLNFSRGIELYNSSGNTIQGNYVGTNAAGTARLDNVGAGIGIDGDPGVGSDNNLIGGAVAGAGNLCSGGGTEGIYVSVDSNGNTIQGNVIGRRADGTLPIANLAEGIKIQSPGNIVGGDTPAKGNLISGNGTTGVRIENNVATGNAVLGNRIYGNGALGIDLAGDGVTNNDALDSDIGPNNRLNFPVIGGVSVVGTSLVVSFSLDVPAGSYRVEFFRNPSGVDVPNGEGEIFAGFTNVTHGGGGSRSFSAAITGASGDRITATTTLCTDGGVCAAFSDTSEFSANLLAVPTNYRSIGTAPNDSTGSVNTTNTSQVVAGVGTSWQAINRGRGDVISICDQAFPTCTTSTNYTVLSVASNSQLTLTTAYAGSTGPHGYTIRRQFTTLAAWEDCIDGQGGSPPPAAPCFYFPAPTSSLVADNRSEVGIAYKDSVFTAPLLIDGSTTDATHTITLTADGVNRNYGLPGTGVVINTGAVDAQVIYVQDDFVTVEWMETRNAAPTFGDGIQVKFIGAGLATQVVLRNNLIHNVRGCGVGIYEDDARVDIYNNIIYNATLCGIWIDPTSLLAGGRLRILNNTIYGNTFEGIGNNLTGVSAARTLLLRNNISVFNGGVDPDFACDAGDSLDLASSNNLSEDGTSGACSPAGGAVTSTVANVSFVNEGARNLHIQPGSFARDAGADLSSVLTTDIDASLRQAPWDIGADEIVGTALYRSVGITATALASGAANALTISGSTATFASGLPNIIGVGDAIQYDSDNNGSIDALAFIHGRTNSQTYTVKNKSGAAPTPTAVADTDWSIYRAYTSLINWAAQNENASINAGLQNFDTSTNLVSANTTMNVACYGDGIDTGPVTVTAAWITGVDNYIRIYTPYLPFEVGTSQRHSGTWNTTTAYRLQAAPPANSGTLWLQTNYVRVDGLQIWQTNDATYTAGIYMNLAAGVSSYEISNNIVRGIGGAPSQPGRIGINTFAGGTAGSVAKIWNNLVYDFTGIQIDVAGILLDDPDFTHYVYNNTVVDGSQGIAQYNGTVVAKNNLAYNNSNNWNGAFGAASTNNLSGPGADPQTPGTNARNGVAVTFVNAPLDDFHLAGGDVGALNQGTNLSADLNLPISLDIDHQVRVPAWDIGADDANGTTAVKLMSFEARPLDSAISLAWQTGSELDNLGFHVYRALSENGPWTRVTASLIPGLGSSAVGRAYSFRDGGLTNGVRYFYRLEDVDASSKTTSHGPVSAVPLVGASDGAPGSEAPGASPGAKKNASSGSCPEWVLAAYGSMAGSSASSATLRCTRHGDPEAVSLGVVSRDVRQATLELRTGGFYALREASGRVRVFVPGFDFPQDPQAPALPFRRALVDAVVGRRAQLGGVRALDPVGFPGLVPASLGKLEMEVSRDGTVRAGRRAVRESAPQHLSTELARLLPSVFQGETKSAVVQITPLRFDARRQQIVLSKRVLVKLLFTARETGEGGRGSFGRRQRPEKPVTGELLARLYTTGRGLHAASFEQLFPGRQRGLASSQLRLERQGQAQGFHLEPAGDVFGPGSVLYFHADTTASSTDFSSETAWELVRARDGVPMPLVSATPSGGAVTSTSTGRASFETNRFYQPGLLEAEDLWLWEALASGATRAKSFSLSGVDAASSQAAELEVFLQGASESGGAIDHHVSVSLNGTPVGEAQFAGKKPYRMSLSVPASLLHDGANELSLTNVADTGVSSFVFLDRFTLAHPQLSSLAGGRFDGWWPESGSVSVSASGAVSEPVRIVDVTAPVPVWLTGFANVAGTVRFRVEAGHRYRVESDSALFSPRIEQPQPSSLKSAGNQADYLLIAPRAFLAAAEPLVQRRQDQGLAARAVAFEEIADEFGHGQPSAEAIKSFLAYAFQSWTRPSPRYVLLLGDSTYDPRNFIGTSQPSPLPALWAKTSYLWTASDPLLAAVNGEDSAARSWRSAGSRPRPSSRRRGSSTSSSPGRIRARASRVRRRSSPTTPTSPGTSRPTRATSPTATSRAEATCCCCASSGPRPGPACSTP